MGSWTGLTTAGRQEEWAGGALHALFNDIHGGLASRRPVGNGLGR